MKPEASSKDPLEFIKELNAKQKNLVWPDFVVNGRAVDAFLWRGSPNPTLVQRIGACLFGSIFIGLGVLLLFNRTYSWLYVPISWGTILLGLRFCRNGFRKRGRRQNENERS